jgi:NADPH:quinone reductase-like Zn-dependent oxidoreductase
MMRFSLNLVIHRINRLPKTQYLLRYHNLSGLHSQKMSTTSLPRTIKGVTQPNWLSTQITSTELTLPQPKPDSEEHLIKVHATSPCAGELHWGKDFPSLLNADKSLGVPCYDLSGVVISAPTSSPFQPGAEIYTRTSAARDGNLREYTIAITSELALKPKSLTWEEAASIPLSAFTAYQALFEHGGVEAAFDDAAGKERNSKKSVLVTGAAGGVGSWVLQLANAAGVGRIVAVCGPDKSETVKVLGATEVINYREQSIDEYFASGKEKVDMALDVVAGQSLIMAWRSVKSGGNFVAIRPFNPEDKPEGVSENVEAKFFIMEAVGSQLNAITKMLDQKIAKAVIDSVWAFEKYAEAFDKVESGHSNGKVIIKVP